MNQEISNQKLDINSLTAEKLPCGGIHITEPNVQSIRYERVSNSSIFKLTFRDGLTMNKSHPLTGDALSPSDPRLRGVLNSETTNEDSGGGGRSVWESWNERRIQSEEALAQWRSDQVENVTPPYWDIDDVDHYGSKPFDLYGKGEWRVENFSKPNRREIGSNVFEFGGCKWFIVIYPQGWNVCNHLSLFLCVANPDELLPGWSHFTQFTVSLANRDSKKSKHSDMLHRFCKKEPIWGWQKFMELPKLQEGFIDDSDTLMIKVQVQVIRESVDRPFRCLYSGYRRELVKVYLSNVEQICWRFVDLKRSSFGGLIEDKAKWASFCTFWRGLDQNTKRQMSQEKMDVILKIVVKLFFIKKDLTSILVMDALYSGLKALEGQTKNKKSRPRLMDNVELPAPIISIEKDVFMLDDDVLLLLERAAREPPLKDEMGPMNFMKNGNVGEDFSAEAIEHDERRLTELARRTLEIIVLVYVFSNKMVVPYKEAIALERQEELIREEEEAGRAESEQKAKTEKKSKKKQAKQKKNKNKGKEKKGEEKVTTLREEKDVKKEECVRAKAESSAEKPDRLGDLSAISDSVDSSADILPLDSEDRESSPVHWEIDTSELHPTPLVDTNRGRVSSIPVPNGAAERKRMSTVDDSSSTSIPSGGANASNFPSQKWLSKGKTLPGKVSDANNLPSETEEQPSKKVSGHKTQSHSSEVRRVDEVAAATSPIREPESSGKRNHVSKDRDTVHMQEQSAAVLFSPKPAPWNHLSSTVQAKPEKKVVSSVDNAPKRKLLSAKSPSSDQASPSRDTKLQTVGARADVQKTASLKPAAHPASSISRLLNAPIIPPKQASGGGESSNEGRIQSEEALAEWRSDGVENVTPPYWDDIDDEDDYGSKPSELYGKIEWRIENFSKINKRQLISNVYEFDGSQWIIVMYPQGCDVCDHLSLFLCVANQDELLPGWSHFAQFTIAVMNKDSKKSKHSDMLHRFCKKLNNWGWQKFMELPKLQEGFIDDSDTLIIKAQVQVIRESVDRPFRFLHGGYRRELVRAYLSNVEQICWRFLDDKRSRFGRLIGDKAVWSSFCAFWMGLDQNTKRQMSREKMDVILKMLLKLFFIERDVTSLLVMDALYSGWKTLEGQTKNKKSRPRLMDNVDLPAPMISIEKDVFVLVDDVLLLLERAAREPVSLNRMKNGNVGDDFSAEAIERDERRLNVLARRTLEIFVLAYIFSNKMVVSYQEAIALARQEELIREEEEACLAESEQKAAKKEKKSKKKQAKQKKNKNKGKEKKREEKVTIKKEEKDVEKEECVSVKAETSAEKPDTLGGLSDISDSVDSSADILPLDSEDRESSHDHWEIDISELHPTPSVDTNIGRVSSIPIPNGAAERKCMSTVDDSSSTSIPSGGANASNFPSQKWLSKGKTLPGKVSDANNLPSETEEQPSKKVSGHKIQSHSAKVRRVDEAAAAISPILERKSPGERNPVSKDRDTVQIQEKSAAVLFSPRAAPWNHLSSTVQTKPEKKVVSNVDNAPKRKLMPAKSPSSDQASPSRDTQLQTVGARAYVQKTASPKPAAQPTPSVWRPVSAPIIPPKQASPVTSTASLARSKISTGRLGSPTHSQAYIPQSYKHAILGSSGFNHSSSQSTGGSTVPPYSHPSPISVSDRSRLPTNVGSWDVSSGGLLWTGGSTSDSRTIGNHGMNHYNKPVAASTKPTDFQMGRTAQSGVTDEFPHMDIINDLLEEFPHMDIINDLLEEEHGMKDSRAYHVAAPAASYFSYDLHSSNPNLSGRIKAYRDFWPSNGH